MLQMCLTRIKLEIDVLLRSHWLIHQPMKYHNHWVAILYLNKKNEIFSKSKQTADNDYNLLCSRRGFWISSSCLDNFCSTQRSSLTSFFKPSITFFTENIRLMELGSVLNLTVWSSVSCWMIEVCFSDILARQSPKLINHFSKINNLMIERNKKDK